MPDPYEYRDALPHGPAHQRGAGLNPGNRFESTRLHVLGDEIDRYHRERDQAGYQKHERIEVDIIPDATKTIINRVTPTSDVPFDWTLNPYRGCEHGCIYCFARPYHEYLGYSCGLDFETKIVAKMQAAELLKKELAKPSWKGEPIVMSAITDIYQPLEKRLELARDCLQVLADCGQAVSTMTKGALVLRDIDLWQKLAAHNAGRVTVTLVTLDDQLAKKLEPRAASPQRRLYVIRELAKAGIPVSVNIAPVIPGLTDQEMPQILRAVANAGATRVAWVLLRLPYQVKDLFLDWLQRHVTPERAQRVETMIRQTRGGKLYDAGKRRARVDDTTSKMVAQRPSRQDRVKNSDFKRGRGSGAHADQLKQVFDVYTRKYGLNRDVRPLNTRAFRRPDLSGQMGLFDCDGI